MKKRLNELTLIEPFDNGDTGRKNSSVKDCFMGMRLWVYSVDADILRAAWGSNDFALLKRITPEFNLSTEPDDASKDDEPSDGAIIKQVLIGKVSSRNNCHGIWRLVRYFGTLLAEEECLVDGKVDWVLKRCGVVDLINSKILNGDARTPLPFLLPSSDPFPTMSYIDAAAVREVLEKMAPLDVMRINKQIARGVIRIYGWIEKAAANGQSLMTFVT